MKMGKEESFEGEWCQMALVEPDKSGNAEEQKSVLARP